MRSKSFSGDLLYNRENKFCTYSNANVYVTTFNVNGQEPPDYLGNWLALDMKNPPDLIAIGLQEMDLTLGTYVIDSVIKQEQWLSALEQALPKAYERVEYVRLIGIFLVLYKNKLSKFEIPIPSTAIMPTGFLNFGNKGGVGISLMMNDTTLCIINSHLAAGNEELDRRNQDYRDVSQMMFANFKGIYDHDVVIWMGDLNYRLSASLSSEEIINACTMGQHGNLFQFDQLREQQTKGLAFEGFMEVTPSFKPTYKFDIGTSNWDSSEKKRMPAWCDRILYWTRNKNVKIEQKSYRSSEAVTFSDHKPVTSQFGLAVKKLNRPKQFSICDDRLSSSKTGLKANILYSQISLSTKEVHFGDVTFSEPKLTSFIIKNVGMSAARFHFSNHIETVCCNRVFKNWLTVTPGSSFVEKDNEVSITLQACITNSMASSVNKRTPISCILIVSLEQGQDHFVMVTASYVPPGLVKV